MADPVIFGAVGTAVTAAMGAATVWLRQCGQAAIVRASAELPHGSRVSASRHQVLVEVAGACDGSGVRS
jgi:hypothetical protein